LSFREATRSRSDCAAFAGHITDTSMAVALSIAVVLPGPSRTMGTVR